MRMREQGGRGDVWAHRKSPAAMAPTLTAMDVTGKGGGRETSDLDQEAARGGRVAGSMEGEGRRFA